MINNPVYVKKGGSTGGLHYSKVRAESSEETIVEFYYQVPGDGIKFAKSNFEETACVDGSVYITRAYGNTAIKNGERAISMYVENDVLVLKGTVVYPDS